MKFKKAVCLLCAAAFFALCGCAGEESFVDEDYSFYNGERTVDTRSLSPKEYAVYNTVGTDMFGRSFGAADGRKEDKTRYTGMFYFLNTGSGNDVKGIYNVTEIIEKYGEEEFGKDTANSPALASHIWGEPALGYYSAGDTFVMRKHIEMLTAAGIDFIILDCSNTVTYNDVAKKLFDIIAEYRAAGWNAPQVMYMLSNSAPDAALINLRDIYSTFYTDESYADVWFKPQPENKPMLAISPDARAELEETNDPLAEYFYFRDTQWPINENGSYTFRENGLPWMEYEYPQPVHIDTMNVSVAQHTTVKFSDKNGSRGRGWTEETGNDHENFGRGANFENQWKTVMQNDAALRFVTITGWNEWSAQKLYDANLGTHNGYFMCDTFNDEYSRDIEPSLESKLLDTPYLQTIGYVRDWTSTEAVHYDIPEGTHSMSDFSAWENAAVYEDFVGESSDREWPRFDGKVTLRSPAARVDFQSVSVCVDEENAYFRIETVGAIPAREGDDPYWMNLMIKPANSLYTDAYGYSYVINRDADNILAVDKNGEYKTVGKAEIAYNNNVMLISVPLSAIGLTKENCFMDFKVADDFGNNVMDFYSEGDCMPVGRLSYRFGY
ncbi:MAG TPA: hypothetical protein H9729_00225 [Candidatus Borkfalkia excrementigallinarum]|uniref:Uncharacterized protein n=1 Tax=Candidatus Borkfalkia excrementigallinarum TaxID=2838506 RepID=A0A9D1ZUF0_9FIRM|nr:hypothetical protein [Candidatus Borkfalkia excrementigallinarum]